MKNQPVTSREYKLMLNVDRFAKQDLGIEGFWNLVKFLVEKQGGTVETQNNPVEIRRTWYLDTPGGDLTRNRFILRVRADQKGDQVKYKITLKYRNPDRYLAAAQDVSATKPHEIKFEEDIIPPFYSHFSLSSSIKTTDELKLQQWTDAVTVFPGLAAVNVPPDTPLAIVSNFKAHEVARKFGKLKFAGGTVKAAFSFWYLIGGIENEIPIVAEFSFNYDTDGDAPLDPTKLEQFPAGQVQETNRFFLSLQNQTGWLNPNAVTKTAFALESL